MSDPLKKDFFKGTYQNVPDWVSSSNATENVVRDKSGNIVSSKAHAEVKGKKFTGRVETDQDKYFNDEDDSLIIDFDESASNGANNNHEMPKKFQNGITDAICTLRNQRLSLIKEESESIIFEEKSGDSSSQGQQSQLRGNNIDEIEVKGSRFWDKSSSVSENVEDIESVESDSMCEAAIWQEQNDAKMEKSLFKSNAKSNTPDENFSPGRTL